MTIEDNSDENQGWTTIDLDAIEDAEDVEIVLTDEEDLDEDAVEDENAKKEEEKKRPSRSEERIRQLVSKEKEARQALLDAQARIKELETTSSEKMKQSAESQKSLIDQQISTIKESIQQASEDQDFAKLADLTVKLSSLEVDRRIAAAQVEKAKVAPTTKVETPAKEVQLPEEMQYWIEANPWAVSPETTEDRAKIRAVRRISRELSAEGFEESDPEFFDELDLRLEKAFASKGVYGVEYSKDTKSSAAPDVKSKRTSPVSASARTPASRHTRIALDPSEQRMAEQLGIDPKKYALRKKAREDSKDTWTTIV